MVVFGPGVFGQVDFGGIFGGSKYFGAGFVLYVRR